MSIKGRLKNYLDYWENVIGANAVVTSVNKEGYKITFTYTPQKAYFKNNKSVLRNNDFVTDSIKDLLANKLVKETNNTPHVVSPLPVAENSAGKKRLILDLRYVNKHLHTHKVKFDDWKCFQNFLNAGSKFMFKFFKLISDSRGKLMVKLGILFLQFCHLDLTQPNFCLQRLSVLY